MEKMCYRFSSCGYLVTLVASPDLFEKALQDNDTSEDGGRRIHRKLILGENIDTVSFPVDFTVFDGKKIRDVIEMRWSSGFLISTRIKELFEENGITGWKPYDVVVKGKNGEVIPGCHGFTVTGRYPELVPAPDDIVPDFYHPECWKGFCIICSQRVVDLLRKYKIRDFNITTYHINDNNEVISYERVKI